MPQGFVSKARKGGNTHLKAGESWERLRAWLRLKAGASTTAPKATDEAACEDKVEAQLVDAIREANTVDKLDDLAQLIMEGMARKQIDRSNGPMLIDVLKERRQLLAAKAEEAARVQSGKPVTVEVVWVNDWRKDGA